MHKFFFCIYTRYVHFISHLSSHLVSTVSWRCNAETTDYFRSPRLTYYAIDNPNDSEIFHSISLNSEAFANSNAALIKPFTRKESKHHRSTARRRSWGAYMPSRSTD